jgi:glutathione S-transferase
MALTLYFSPTSPFARKVRIAILELGLADEVTEIAVNPFAPDAEYLVINPLSKIPTLVTEDGVVIPDSRHILDYVIELGSGTGRQLAAPTGDRWTERRLRQLADGVIDAGVAANLERRRDPSLVSQAWADRQTAAIGRALDELETAAIDLATEGAIGPLEITLASALGYLDLRLDDLKWREQRPALATWFETLGARPSIVSTRPPG